MQEISVPTLAPDPFERLTGPAPWRHFAEVLEVSRHRLAGRTLWHVNSAAAGGGAAEILRSVLGYLLGGGVATRRLVLEGDEAFFTVTKRVHNLLHGEPADHDRLGIEEHETYGRSLSTKAAEVLRLVAPGDPVVLHDPQSLGLARALQRHGAHVVWICHVGADEVNGRVRLAWDVLRPYVDDTQAVVFSRPGYVWDGERTAPPRPPLATTRGAGCVSATSPRPI